MFDFLPGLTHSLAARAENRPDAELIAANREPAAELPGAARPVWMTPSVNMGAERKLLSRLGALRLFAALPQAVWPWC